MSDSKSHPESGADRRLAEEMYARFQAGESKSALEIEYWDDGTSHGKRFTAFIRKHLGIETETKSKQSAEIDRLTKLLRRRGISPSPAGDLSTEDRLVTKAREAALAAIRLYNDPTAGFRTDGFIVDMVIAWNSLLQAMMERDGVDYPDPFTTTHFVEVDFGDGRGLQDFYTYLLCQELLTTPSIVDGSYAENRFVFPYTYRAAGTFNLKARVHTRQWICVVPLEPQQEGRGKAQLSVSE